MLFALGCGQVEPGPELPSTATCGPNDAGVQTAFAASAVWERSADSSSALVLVVTVKKTDPSFQGALKFDLVSNSELSAVNADATGGFTLRTRPFTGGMEMQLLFFVACTGKLDGVGRLTASWATQPVEGRTETVTLASP